MPKSERVREQPGQNAVYTIYIYRVYRCRDSEPIVHTFEAALLTAAQERLSRRSLFLCVIAIRDRAGVGEERERESEWVRERERERERVFSRLQSSEDLSNLIDESDTKSRRLVGICASLYPSESAYGYFRIDLETEIGTLFWCEIIFGGRSLWLLMLRVVSFKIQEYYYLVFLIKYLISRILFYFFPLRFIKLTLHTFYTFSTGE